MYGADDMTTINQKKLALARSIAVKLVVSGGMSENASFAPRTLSVPFDTGVNHLLQIIPAEVHQLFCLCPPPHSSSHHRKREGSPHVVSTKIQRKPFFLQLHSCIPWPFHRALKLRFGN